MICIGNPLREDDGVARHVASRLVELGVPPGVRVVCCHQLTPELAADAAAVDRVVLVDAAVSSHAGCVETRELDVTALPVPDVHEIDPSSFIALARMLGGRDPRASLVVVGGCRFGFGEELSRPVAAAVRRAAEVVSALVAKPR
ncbi:MAG: hydrogenase maturation protease [Acidobacteria bacterium]|nr:hydrogenase maturation protease [Acidobacteriota bacterium]